MTSTDADDTHVRELPAGTQFGPYRVVRLLGAGGMGSVYEALHTQINKRVALKTLHPELASNPGLRERFNREGKAASKLDHPHVVSVSDYGVEAGIPFLVMEFLSGEALYDLLVREGALPPERTMEIFLPVCSAVHAAHRVGIVHRDLKPENVFLARNALGQEVPKVLDFGISKLTDTPRNLALTASGALLGTSHYMSPEQAESAKDVDGRSDQYTLGVMLYEALTGRLPFEAPTVLGQLGKIHAGIFDRPSLHRKGMSPELEAVILRAMARDPAARFPSVDDLARALLLFADAATRAVWQRALGTRTEAGDYAATVVDARPPPMDIGATVVDASSPFANNPAMGATRYESAGGNDVPRAAQRPAPRRSFAEAAPEIVPTGIPSWVRAAIVVVIAMVVGGVVWAVWLRR